MSVRDTAALAVFVVMIALLCRFAPPDPACTEHKDIRFADVLIARVCVHDTVEHVYTGP